MANEQTISIKISLSAHASLKKICEEKGLFMSGFADRAIMEKVERIRKQEKETKKSTK